MERNLFPSGTADGAAMVAVIDTGGYAVEMERVSTFSREEGMAASCFHATQAYGASFLGTSAGGAGAPGKLRSRRRSHGHERTEIGPRKIRWAISRMA